jgi:hypothetical protein
MRDNRVDQALGVFVIAGAANLDGRNRRVIVYRIE